MAKATQCSCYNDWQIGAMLSARITALRRAERSGALVHLVRCRIQVSPLSNGKIVDSVLLLAAQLHGHQLSLEVYPSQWNQTGDTVPASTAGAAIHSRSLRHSHRPGSGRRQRTTMSPRRCWRAFRGFRIDQGSDSGCCPAKSIPTRRRIRQTSRGGEGGWDRVAEGL